MSQLFKSAAAIATMMLAGWVSLKPALAGESACWSTAALANRASESQIRQNIPDAFVSRPRDADNAAAGPYARLQPGALRRVDLPDGVKVVALTFDLCEQPHEVAGFQGDIVDYLRRDNVAATFFAGGKWLLTHTARSQQLMADPLFEIGNHGWSHRNMRLLDAAGLASEIDGAQAAYLRVHRSLGKMACLTRDGHRRVSEQQPARQTLLRFPFGACNPAALKAVQERGLLAVQWDVSSADPWKGQSEDNMVADVVKRTRPGSILLFHANGRGWNTPKALPRIVAALRAKGYTFATVSQLLKLPGARPVMAQTCYDSKPGDSDRYDQLGQRLETLYAKFWSANAVKPEDR